MADGIADQMYLDLLDRFRFTRDDYSIKITEHQNIIRKHRQEIEALKRQRQKITELWQGVIDMMHQLGH